MVCNNSVSSRPKFKFWIHDFGGSHAISSPDSRHLQTLNSSELHNICFPSRPDDFFDFLDLFDQDDAAKRRREIHGI